MYKTYTTRDLWELMRQVYHGVIHWRWDTVNGYYLNDDGKPNGPVNCHFMAYHVLHHVHQPDEEDAYRAACIVRHVMENRDAHLGPLRTVFGDEQGGGRHYPRLLLSLAIPLKYWEHLGLGEEMKARFREEFYHYYQVDKACLEADLRNNQHTASHFVSCAYAYWATGDALFLDRAREIAARIPHIYTERDLRAVRCYYPGSYPDWTWNYMQKDHPEKDEGSTHSPVYQNGHVGFWLMGHRMFELAGVKEHPWMDFLHKTARVCLLNNMASNGLDPYVIEPYPLVERYQPASQIYLGSLAAWAASCPQALRSPALAGLARFLYDRVVQTYEGIMAPGEGLPRDFYHLSEYRDPATGNYQRKLACNYCFLDSVVHTASFAALASVAPRCERYWDWRWFWDLLHVRGDGYDAHLAGWTNRRTKEPCYVGGSINRLFSPDGTLIYPFGVNKCGWRVETDAGTFDSTELCRGGKAPGYEFWVEVDGKRLEVPEDYAEPSWPITFEQITSHWKVDCTHTEEKVGAMVIENVFEPERIAVRNRFLPGPGVQVERAIQSIPFTRDYQQIAWKLRRDGSEGGHALDWFRSFQPCAEVVELSQVEHLEVVAEQKRAVRLVITPEDSKGQLVLNEGALGETWPDGWNYLELRQEGGTGQPIVQGYQLRIMEGGGR